MRSQTVRLYMTRSNLRSGDTLIVWELDRLARSMKQLMETIEPVPSGPDSNSSWLIFRGARHINSISDFGLLTCSTQW